MAFTDCKCMKITQSIHLLIGLLMLLGATGCVKDSTTVAPVRIADRLDFKLRPPETFGQTLSVLQRIEAQHGERIFETLVQLEINPEQVILVGFTSVGVRTFTVRWSGTELITEALAGVDMPFGPKYILADLQIALWPEIPAADALQIRETQEPPYVREVLRAGVPVVRVRYETMPVWQGRIDYHHLERGYRLSIHPLQINPNP